MSRYRKALVATVGGVAMVAAAIPQGTPAWRWAQVIVALATALGVYATPNRPAPTP